MKRHPKMFLFALMIFAAAFFPTAAIGSNGTEPQQQKAATEEQETDYGEEEYNAYDAASKEANFEKRGAMLLDFIQKYPKSTLMSYIKPAYENLLRECSQAKQYAVLEPLAEKWLKVYPNNIQTLAYIAEASHNLGNSQKYVETLQAIYAIDPKGTYAVDILRTYKELKNQAKIDEWTNKILKMPEYDTDFELRFDFVQKYIAEDNYPKAAEWAALTIKSADLVKEPSKDVQDQLRKVRYACYLVIGTNQYKNKKFAEAIRSLQQALKYERHGEPYYYIGMSQWELQQIEEATLSFACAELVGGGIAAQAKEKVEQLYKGQHNDTLVGIDKIYRRAKEACAK